MSTRSHDRDDHKTTIPSNDMNDYLTDLPGSSLNAPPPAPRSLVGTWAHLLQTYHPTIRLAASELLGTMMIILFGCGVNCQVTLSSNPKVASHPFGDYTSVSLAWGVGISLGAWIASASGSHINPAVTLACAVYGRFPWKRVPLYIGSQVVGAIFGTLIVYATYTRAIDIFEGGSGIRTEATAGLFAANAIAYLPSASCFFQEFLGTALLVLVVFAVTDSKGASQPPQGLVPLVLFITFLGESAAFGMQSSFALNPARDFGPRIALSMVGYGKQVWTYRNQYWLWTPIIATITGGVIGAGVYEGLLADQAGRVGRSHGQDQKRGNDTARVESHRTEVV